MIRTNKYGELIRIRKGRMVIEHQPFPRAFGKIFERLRLEIKAASTDPQLQLPFSIEDPRPSQRQLYRARIRRAVACATFGLVVPPIAKPTILQDHPKPK